MTKERALCDWFFSYFHKNGLVGWCKTNHFVGGVFSLHTGCWLSKTDTVGTCSKHQSQKGVHFTHIGSNYANFCGKKETFYMRKKCNPHRFFGTPLWPRRLPFHYLCIWCTKMAAEMSFENELYRVKEKASIRFRHLIGSFMSYKDVRQEKLRRNPSGNWVILIFSGQKPCTRMI